VESEVEKLPLTHENLKIFSGNANLKLAKNIASYLDMNLGKASVSRFSDGEIQIRIEESVRGVNVFVIQPTCKPVNDNLMELLIMIDALSRASARQITAVIPYYGYAKQEKKTTGREPISAKLVANLLTKAGASRVVTVDLHAAAIQGFFDIPVDNLMTLPIMIKYYKKMGFTNKDLVVVSPDAGGVTRAHGFAERLNASLAIIFKRRPRPEVAEVMEMVGNVKGKSAIMIDDMISTGGTLIEGANMLIKNGAKEVFACTTHAILSAGAAEKLENSPFKEIVVTDTIPFIPNKNHKKFVVLSIAPLLGAAIRKIHFNLSVSELFR
jgi:ribose-phosphate pyrophosphokinase